jgi:hypothetical protein
MNWLILAIAIVSAPDPMKALKAEMLAAMQKCGSDGTCRMKVIQDYQPKLKAARNGILESRAAVRSEAAQKAAAERDKHGGKAGGPDGNYSGYPDWPSAEAALNDKKSCLHKAGRFRLRSKPPEPRGSRVTQTSPPSCLNIDVHKPSLRYCQIDRTVVAWHMTKHWEDRYWSDPHFAEVHRGNCLSRLKAAFLASDDEGFRLAILDAVGDLKANGEAIEAGFLAPVSKAKVTGRLKERLEWLSN